MFGQFGLRSITRKRTSRFNALRVENVKAYSVHGDNDWWIFDQYNLKKACWDTFIDVMVAYSVITSLYFLGFQEPTIGGLVIDHFVRVLFIIDICLKFFTEITGNRGNSIRDQKMIAEAYVRGWFFFDLIACIPFREMWRPDVEYLCRMIRVVKIPNAVNMIDGRGFSLIFTALR
jgi:hypothetical protein